MRVDGGEECHLVACPDEVVVGVGSLVIGVAVQIVGKNLMACI